MCGAFRPPARRATHLSSVTPGEAAHRYKADSEDGPLGCCSARVKDSVNSAEPRVKHQRDAH